MTTGSLEKLLIGRTLVGRYRVDQVLGRGGMSVVYRATDSRLERPVALKIVTFPVEVGPAEREALRKRLKREAAAAGRIPSHPNVVQVYDYGTDVDLDLDFIAMELLPGIDLKEALRERRFGTEKGLEILIGAARGVAAGHRAGIIHRDVKPGNIFLIGESDPEGVKILDFGIAKALEPRPEDDLTQHDLVPHSPAYVSPEQLDPARPVTAASDVYQLGLVGYEILAGDRPFTEEEREKIKRNEPVAVPVRGSWSEVRPELRHTIERALAVDPRQRYRDAREFGDALEAPSDDATVLLDPRLTTPDPTATIAAPYPPPGTAAAAPSRPGRHHLQRKHALLAASLAGVALLAWLIARGTTSEVAPAGEETARIDVEALQEELRPLMIEAFHNLRAAVSDEEGPAAAAAVQEVIGGLHQSWARGDLDRHLDHYAEQVDFRGSPRTPRERIRAVRQETIDQFPDREITVTGVAVEFSAPGMARALVDRSWRFSGRETWEGAAREEMIVAKEGDEWRIIGETELERVR